MWKGVQDPLKRKALVEFDRLALHAAELVFEHPVHRREMTLTARLPEEFETLLGVLRGE
jgi:23S rRNA-/tRNA-specific pseudouridylate synthase